MEKDLKRIFATNLKKYMTRDQRSQVDIAKVAGVSPSTASEWINAKKYPRMDKIEILAEYLCINMSDLVEENQVEKDMAQDELEILMLFRNSTGRAKELAKMALLAGQINNGSLK